MFFSIGAIQAGDVNVTDLDVASPVDDEPINLEECVQLNDIDDVVLTDNVKNQTQMTPQDTSIYYKGSYDVVLKDSTSNTTIANKNINFVINNVKYVNMTNNQGIASIILNLNPGTYTATAAFGGDNEYAASSVASQISILPSIKATDITKYYKGSQKYTATFFDSYGNVLKGIEVIITANGKSYTKKTNNKGVATLALGFKPGNYQISATNPITGYKSTNNVKILSTISASNFKKVKGDSRKFTVKFLKSNGKDLINQKVKIKVNGKVYKVKTNYKGQASLLFNDLKKGTYKAVCYNMDGLSQSYTIQIYSKASTKLTVNTPDAYTILPNGSKDVNVKFSTSIGGATKVGKSIKIKINGDTYYRKTNSKGEVNFKLPMTEGIFTVVYEFSGDKFFKPSKVAKSVTVLKTNDTTLTVNGLRAFGFEAGTNFRVAFTAGKVPLTKKTVVFTVDGKSYSSITDSNGIASVPINLNIGKYTISYRAPGDALVKGTSGSCAIDVFERNPSKLVWKCGSSYKDSSQTFKVLLTNSKGEVISGGNEVISGGNVELTIDGKTYRATTSSDGYATFTASAALGKYNVSVQFTGSNSYLPSSTSYLINVELSKFGRGLNVKDGAYYSSAYLKSTSHCQVNNAKIKTLVGKLTSGLSDDIDKAKALFNYVRDNIDYSYYYDSKHGAVGILNLKSGNCVDQAHLLISMYRTAGFKARYVHGTCRFSDGTFGHVWTQVLIGKTWVVGDPISYGNSLGKIKNWNTNTYRLHSRYVSLPF